MSSTNPGQPILAVKNLKRKFGDRTIMHDVSFSVQPGERIGVLGVNGAGKSSLMKILAGRDGDFEGSCHISKGVSVGYVPQEPELDLDKTVRENVEAAVAETRAYMARYDAILAAWEDPEILESEEKTNALLEEQGEVQEMLEHRDAMDPGKLDARIDQAMEALRLPDGDKLGLSALRWRASPRLALYRALLAHPDVLILDEPTNHLDSDTITWLEQFLADYSGSYLLVTHDRYFLDRVANRMLELNRGKSSSPTRATTRSFLEAKEKQEDIQSPHRCEPAQGGGPGARVDSLDARRRGARKSKARIAAIRQAGGAGGADRALPTRWICASPSVPGWAARFSRCAMSRSRTTTNVLFEHLELGHASRRHRGHHRRQRAGQDHAGQHHHRRTRQAR